MAATAETISRTEEWKTHSTLNLAAAKRAETLSEFVAELAEHFGDAPALAIKPSFRTRITGFAETREGPENDTLHKRETLELVRAYYRITDPAIRKRVYDLIKSLTPGFS